MTANNAVVHPTPAILHQPIFLRALPFALLGFLLPVVSKELGADALAIGGLYAVIPLIHLLLRPAVGWAIDHYGRRNFLIVGLAMTAVSMLLYAVLSSVALLYAARIVQAVSAALVWIATQTIVADLAAPDEIGTAMGRMGEMQARGEMTGILAGFAVFTLLGDFENGWRLLFVGYALAATWAAWAARTQLPETKEPFTPTQDGERSTLWQSLFQGLSVPLLKLMFIVFTTAISASMLAPIFLVFLLDQITTDVAQLGWAFFPAGIVYSFLPSRMGKLSDRFGRGPLMAIGLVGSGIFSMLMPSLSSLILLAIFNVLVSVGWSMADPAEAAMVADLTAGETRGRAYGWYTFAGSLGAIFGPLIGGWLYDNVGQAVPFYLNGIILVVSAVWVLLFLQRLPQQGRSKHKSAVSIA